MKSKYEFETVEIDGTIAAVPVGDNAADFRGILRVNESALEILNLLKEDTTEEKITDALAAEYPDSERSKIAGYVGEFIRTLSEAGVIED